MLLPSLCSAPGPTCTMPGVALGGTEGTMWAVGLGAALLLLLPKSLKSKGMNKAFFVIIIFNLFPPIFFSWGSHWGPGLCLSMGPDPGMSSQPGTALGCKVGGLPAALLWLLASQQPTCFLG